MEAKQVIPAAGDDEMKGAVAIDAVKIEKKEKKSGSAYLAAGAIVLLVVAVGLVAVVAVLATRSPVVAEPAAAKAMPVASKAGSMFPGEEANICAGSKPKHADPAAQDYYFNNTDCMVDGVVTALEQSGTNVTAGYVGQLDAGDRVPIVDNYYEQGLCPVNVHWHHGAEHLSVGEYDHDGVGPSMAKDNSHRRHLSAKGVYDDEVREGFNCHLYDAENPTHTTEYDWQHCVDTKVGHTYEVHWPHSAAGACGTPNQYQTPFYDGVFCRPGIISLSPLNTFQKIGVQSQVFVIVNDESYYYPDLIRGMIVDGEFGADVAKYTGSTTGTTRDNDVCSRYTPITWQVDRKCHPISASTFDKMCADMKAQRDDMSSDLHPHGARELVAHHLSANNHQGK